MLLDYELMLPDNMLYVDFLGFLNYLKLHTTGSGDDVKYLTWYYKRNCTIDEEIDLVYGIISKNSSSYSYVCNSHADHNNH